MTSTSAVGNSPMTRSEVKESINNIVKQNVTSRAVSDISKAFQQAAQPAKKDK